MSSLPAAVPAPAMAATLVAGPDGGRLAIVDVARGLAIAQMIAYHFCYDLNHFAWIHVQMNSDVRWLSWRTAIVAQFLFLVGVSLALRAGASGNGIRPNWRRWGQIAACAALVSIASWYMFGARWIWFGVLHFVAVAQLLAPRIARYGAVNLALGVILIAIGCSVHLAPFAAPALSWLGFSPVKPHTEDFVPLLPWSGVVLLGIGAAVVWQRGPHARAARWRQPQGRWWRVPALLGRWPLTTYMVHQPVLFGVLSLVARH